MPLPGSSGAGGGGRRIAPRSDFSQFSGIISVWSVEEFPDRFERQEHKHTMDVITKALEAAGVEFTKDDAPGVRSGQGRQAGLSIFFGDLSILTVLRRHTDV